MPTVTNPNLTLTTVNENVTIRVTYNGVFTPAERALADLGIMTYHSHITVHGMDPAGSLTGAEITAADFQTFNFAVTAGVVDQVIAHDKSIVVNRSVLQEDAAAGDTDEIRCKVLIHSVGIPPVFTPDEFTDQETLLG